MTTRIDRRGARGIVIDEREQVLFVGGHATAERSAFWILPGGGIDPGETMLEAAHRELFEETGLRVPAGGLIGPVASQQYRTTRDGVPFTQENHFFLTRVERFEPRVSGGEAYEQDMEFLWIGVDDFDSTEGLRRTSPLRGLIKRLLSGDIPAEPIRLEPIGRH